MYQALYRKYRPRTFDDVSGQEHITRTLKNQVTSDKCSHAYLFVGSHGTGKTTCAKLLARAVNCEAPVDGSPCNVCPSCRAVESGAATDVLELDAASNNGVDNVRALREDAVFLPVELKKRVYIIDEAHMLSGSAFNALLKILEEPPEHLIFILATTELHRVPVTVVSRCQRFSFRRLSREPISERLKSVAEAEGFALDAEAAATLARLADGSMRDALSLLDQCAGGGSNSVDMPRVRETVGLPPRDFISALLEAVAERDVKTAFSLLDGLYRGGLGIPALFEELADAVRDALVIKLMPGADELLSGDAGRDDSDGLARRLDAGRLTHILSALSKARTELTQSAFDKTAAELCIASLCDGRLDAYPEALIARVEALENTPRMVAEAPSGAPRTESARERKNKLPPRAEISPAPAAIVPESDPRRDSSAETAAAAATPAAVSVPDAPSEAPKYASAGDGAFWKGILNRLKDVAGGMLVLPFISDAVAALTGDILTVTVTDSFAVEMLSRENALAALKDAAAAELGRPAAIVTRLAEPSEPEEKPRIPQDVLDRLTSRFGDLIEFEQ